jgi:triphosphoribosyl-dephospho-CoA synthetase
MIGVKISEEKSGLMLPKNYRQTFLKLISRKNDKEVVKFAYECLKEFSRQNSLILEKEF